MNEKTSRFLADLESDIRAEARCGWENARDRWARPLEDRVASCRAIGPLEVAEIERTERKWLVHFQPSKEDIAMFREGDGVRLSRNDPGGDDSRRVVFFGLTEKGLTVLSDRPPEGTAGWTLDDDHLDLSEYYLRALGELATSAHGRDVVMPVLRGEVDGSIDYEAYDEACGELGGVGLDESQIDAVARCLAADRFHLVQGPPGTGKTHALARLVEALVMQGKRVLVTAFTHRAIHHALRRISERVDCPVFKVSDPIPHDAQGIDFRHSFEESGLVDHPGPYVLGITPISLFTSRASGARFDVAVIDETSQMRVEAAIMPMLRAEKWFFFGDHQQLPPVVQRPVADVTAESVFGRLRHGDHSTMLRTTYRMNELLVRWPSENFYGGGLVAGMPNARHRFALKRVSDLEILLGPEPAMVGIEIDHSGCRARSDDEAEAVAELLRTMLEGGLAGREVGVVVPFRAQAAKVRQLLRGARFKGLPAAAEVVVDTVERFQGQEREAMIVGFVVSEREFMERLRGFLVFPQRLNVAVTRARTKVVLVFSRAFREWLEGSECEESRLAASLLDGIGAMERIEGTEV